MEAMVEEITRRVVGVLQTRKPEPASTPAVSNAIAPPEQPRPAAPVPAQPRVEPVRRVSPLRLRSGSGSVLGLDIGRPDPPTSE
jgi:hypothetical protein